MTLFLSIPIQPRPSDAVRNFHLEIGQPLDAGILYPTPNIYIYIYMQTGTHFSSWLVASTRHTRHIYYAQKFRECVSIAKFLSATTCASSDRPWRRIMDRRDAVTEITRVNCSAGSFEGEEDVVWLASWTRLDFQIHREYIYIIMLILMRSCVFSRYNNGIRYGYIGSEKRSLRRVILITRLNVCLHQRGWYRVLILFSSKFINIARTHLLLDRDVVNAAYNR